MENQTDSPSNLRMAASCDLVGPWPNATEPDLLPIMILHRHPDGYVSFAVDRGEDEDKDFRPLVSIRVDQLATYFPQYRDQLLRDSYVGINADWHVRKFGEEGAAYGYPLHRTDRLSYLTAAFVDLDLYKLGMTYGQVLGKVIDMQDAGRLPCRASIIVKTGRGLWLLYLLHAEEEQERAPRAFPECKNTYFRIQSALRDRFARFGADAAAASNAAIHVRVPGSFRSALEEHVQWSIWGEGGRAHSYSLQELATLLGVADGPRRHPREIAAIAAVTPKDAKKQAAGRRGYAMVAARRLVEFNNLRSLRGGFKKRQPSRNKAALIYAYLLRCNRVDRFHAAKMLIEFAAECRPHLKQREWMAAVKSGFEMRFVTDQTIANLLDVTFEEATAIDGIMPPAKRFGPTEPKLKPEKLQFRSIQERRAKILEILAGLGGEIPPVRTMGRLLIEGGFRGNHQTVQKDYKALGIESGRTRAARAETKQKRAELQPSLLLARG